MNECVEEVIRHAGNGHRSSPLKEDSTEFGRKPHSKRFCQTLLRAAYVQGSVWLCQIWSEISAAELSGTRTCFCLLPRLSVFTR